MAIVQQFRIRKIMLRRNTFLALMRQLGVMIRTLPIAALLALVLHNACAADDGKAVKDCPPSARYMMPEGVELKPDLDPMKGVAPADVPGSRAGFEVPPEIKFDLGFNPTGTAFDQSWLPLGQVSVNRDKGTVSIDGQPLDDRDPCAEAPQDSQTQPHSGGASHP